jgi:hypothetical protein
VVDVVDVVDVEGFWAKDRRKKVYLPITTK